MHQIAPYSQSQIAPPDAASCGRAAYAQFLKAAQSLFGRLGDFGLQAFVGLGRMPSIYGLEKNRTGEIRFSAVRVASAGDARLVSYEDYARNGVAHYVAMGHGVLAAHVNSYLEKLQQRLRDECGDNAVRRAMQDLEKIHFGGLSQSFGNPAMGDAVKENLLQWGADVLEIAAHTSRPATAVAASRTPNQLFTMRV